MSRTFCYTALCLRVKPSGESNREAWFLGAEEGIFRATVFGGPRSKLRSNVAPFNQGRIWIYHDPVKDSRKVTDFDVQSWRPGLRDFYERIMAADLLAETILATHAGGGSWEISLKLAGNALDCIENSDEKTGFRVLLHFLWEWTDFLGVRPDLSRCVCGADIAGTSTIEASAGESRAAGTSASQSPVDKVLLYDIGEGFLYCKKCKSRFAAGSNNGAGSSGITLGPGARNWLLNVENLDSKNALQYNPDNLSLRQIRNLILGILTEALGRRLPLWDILEAI